MNFILIRSEGKEIILNSDRIISVTFEQPNGRGTIQCTDQVIIMCDDSEEEIRGKLGVKRGEKAIGFSMRI